MKLIHWVFLGFAIVGVLYFWHNYQGHGGIQGVKSGIGLGNFGGSA